LSDSEIYKIQEGTGRLKRAVYPNGSYVEYTYYGADNPSQVGFVWKVEHKKSDGSLLIGYEYTYDLLGRQDRYLPPHPRQHPYLLRTQPLFRHIRHQHHPVR
jgi:hypothetical protein